MANKAPRREADVAIGKFDILANNVYAHGLIDELKPDAAKQRGMVAAIMGAQAKRGIRKEHNEELYAQKKAAEKKKSRSSRLSRSTSGSTVRWVDSSRTSFYRP